jgi:acetyl-CoA carboxylase carboxyltransferase component
MAGLRYNAQVRFATNGIHKVISFLVLCDSFNIPLVFFHDTPGFLVGREAERNRVGTRVMNYMNAFGQITIPKISIIVRKSYGMAFFVAKSSWNL